MEFMIFVENIKHSLDLNFKANPSRLRLDKCFEVQKPFYWAHNEIFLRHWGNKLDEKTVTT